MTALQLLPRVLAAMGTQVDYAFVAEFTDSVYEDCHTWCVYETSDGDLDTSRDDAYAECHEVCSCEVEEDAHTIAALRNALPGLVAMAEDYEEMQALIVESGFDKPGYLKQVYEATAQRILDAIQQVVTPETWAAWTTEAQE